MQTYDVCDTQYNLLVICKLNSYCKGIDKQEIDISLVSIWKWGEFLIHKVTEIFQEKNKSCTRKYALIPV